MRLLIEKVVIAFEWRDVKRKNVIDSRKGMKERRIKNIKRILTIAFFTEVFESVHRIRGIVTMVRHGRRLRDFEMRERRNNASRRERGYRGRGMRKVIDDVTLRRR